MPPNPKPPAGPRPSAPPPAPPRTPSADPLTPGQPLYQVLVAATTVALNASTRLRGPSCYVPSADVRALRDALSAYGIPLDRYIPEGNFHAKRR